MELFFFNFCCECRFPWFFDWFSVDFGWKINEKKLFFSSLLRSLSNMATLTKHCILRYESYFFVFWVFWFFSKNWWKKRLKISPAKKVEKWPPGDPKIHPKSWKNGRKIAKNPKNCQKSWFFEGSIFWWFFGWPKNRKKEARPSLSNQFSWPWAPLGDYRGNN